MTSEIIAHLSKDKQFKKIIKSTEVPFSVDDGDVYLRLIRAIVSQQLSIKAANTIHGRFLDLFHDRYPEPEVLLGLDLPILRSVGLSYQKAGYIQNVAEFFQNENLMSKDWSLMEDNDIIEYLTQIKGVGKWTVQMLLMFTLNRPDVYPLDDLGIQQAVQKAYNIEEKGRILKNKMTEISEKWRPYRTYASLYLWAWKDNKGK